MALPYLRGWGVAKAGPWRRHSMTRREVSHSSQWDQASFLSAPRGVRPFGPLGHCQCKWTCLYWSPGSAVDLQCPTFSMSCEEEECGKKTTPLFMDCVCLITAKAAHEGTPIKTHIKGYTPYILLWLGIFFYVNHSQWRLNHLFSSVKCILTQFKYSKEGHFASELSDWGLVLPRTVPIVERLML